MMPKEESKKQLITRATQYGVDPSWSRSMVVTSCPLVCVKYDEVSVGLVIASQVALKEDRRCKDRLPHHTPLTPLNLAPQPRAGTWVEGELDHRE